MIVKYDIKLEAYDLIKLAVPTTVIANIPGPTTKVRNGVRYFMSQDINSPEYNEACEKFMLANKNSYIREFLKALEPTAEKYSDFPWTYTILSKFSVKPADEHGDIVHMTLSPTHDQMKSRLHADDIIPAGVAHTLQDTETCMCCQLNEDIYDILTKFQSDHAINCPKCGATIEAAMLEPVSVQAANYYDPFHRVGIYPTCHCPNVNCDAIIALIPTVIEWNANHDVCYTGGAVYMADGFDPDSAAAEIQEIFDKKLWPDIRQFIMRKLHPEDGSDARLDIDHHLKLWTERDFASAICEYWYKHGLKE